MHGAVAAVTTALRTQIRRMARLQAGLTQRPSDTYQMLVQEYVITKRKVCRPAEPVWYVGSILAPNSLKSCSSDSNSSIDEHKSERQQ